MREDDWKIHTLMGNDLTGWEWLEDEDGVLLDNMIVKRFNGYDDDYQVIPFYSTTWEGAGLVLHQLNRDIKFRVRTWTRSDGTTVWIERLNDNEFDNDWELLGDALADTFPLALAKAYISAMEERK